MCPKEIADLPIASQQEIAAFEERLRLRGQAIEAARMSLIERVREFVAAHGLNGGKTGRADYSKIVRLDEIERIRAALLEYDRVRATTDRKEQA